MITREKANAQHQQQPPSPRPPDPPAREAPANDAVPAAAQPQTLTADADLDAVAQALAKPFDVAEVKFKPQLISGNRALAVPFVDARVVMDRLDDVLGVLNWGDSYECLPDGSVVCALKARIGGEWITKTDVGGQSEQPDEGDRKKAAFSDALKRAAVKFGIGRYLYRQTPSWVDYDPQKRQFTGRLPILTGGTTKAPPPPQPQPQAAASVPFHRKLQEYDAKLAGEAVSRAGELVRHVAAAGKEAGFAADMTAWGEDEIELAREETRKFERAKLLDALERLFDAKGEGPERALAKLGARPGSSLAMQEPAQLRQLIAWLRPLPDAPQPAGAGGGR